MTKFRNLLLCCLFLPVLAQAQAQAPGEDFSMKNADFEAELRLLEDNQMKAVEQVYLKSSDDFIEDSVSQGFSALEKTTPAKTRAPLTMESIKSPEKTRRVRSR